MKKSLIAAAFLIGGSIALFADGFKVGADVNFTDYLLQQAEVTTNGNTSWSDLTVRRSPWYTGNTFGRQDLYFKYDSDVWTFYTSFRFDAATTAIGKAYLGVNLLDGTVKLKTGMFQEESFGYGVASYANGPMGRYLAAADLLTNYLYTWRADSQYLTSVEYIPEEPSGLSLFAGVPIDPQATYSNVYPTSTASVSSKWTSAVNRFKVGAKYGLPDGGTVKAFYQNALFSNLGSDTASRKATYIDDLSKGINELFVGVDELPVVEGLVLKAGVDVQYDQALAGKALQNQFSVSAGWDATSELKLTFDTTLTMATPDWVDGNFLPGSESSKIYPLIASGWIFYDSAVAKAAYTLENWVFALAVTGVYEPSTNGHAYVYGQTYAAPVNNGSDGSAFFLGASPSATLVLGAGSLGLGFDVGYESNTGTVSGAQQTNSAFGWRIPVTYTLSL
jgi:hypothetical protein